MKPYIGITRFMTIENSDVGLIDYVLLDLSGGKGKMLDPKKLKDYLAAIDKESGFHDMGVGVAGGLSWDTMYFILTLTRKAN